jgi:hypothetical protein
MFKIILLSLFLLTSSIHGQEKQPQPMPPPAEQEPQPTAASTVEGLELPKDQTVNHDEGFVTVEAKCKGEVRWLVLSQTKVKYTPLSPTSVIVSIPPQDGVIVSVFAIGLVDGKMTDFATTNITVKGGAKPGPEPAVQPRNAPAPREAGPVHFTFLVNVQAVPPELAQALNSPTLRQSVTAKGNFLRVYDLNNPIVAQRKLDQIVRQVGGNAIVVVQRNNGVVLTAQPAPRNEAEITELIKQYTNGN